MRCNRCGEDITACDSCGMRFDKDGTSIYCVAISAGQSATGVEYGAKKGTSTKTHGHYCSGDCVEDAGASDENVESAESYV